MLKSFIAVIGLFLCSTASAQVYFQPAQSQFGPSPTFFYGGSDPRVFAHAARSVSNDDIAGPFGTRYFVGTRSYGTILRVRPPAVFVDQLPYFDAGLFHYTPADARNAANAALPTYFRKSDLLRAAIPSGDGQTWVVPPQAASPAAPYIDIRPYHRPAAGAATHPSAVGPSTRPVGGPQPLLIIPKSLIEPPAPPAVQKVSHVVAAVN